MQKKIMAIVAHADDLEVYCGGTMAKFVTQGYQGVEVLLTASMAGAAVDGGNYRQSPPAATIPIRDQELRAGAASLGIEEIVRLEFQNTLYSDGQGFVWMGDKDFDYNHPDVTGSFLPAVAINESLLEPVVETIVKHEPEIVICQHMFSGFEHLTSAHIIHQAFRKALERGADLGQLWLPIVARHCTWATDFRIFPSPNVIIDITDFWEQKEKAILAHKSQKMAGAIDKIRKINEYWGILRETQLAEPFFTLCDGRYR